MIELPFHEEGEDNLLLEIKRPLLKGLLITMTQQQSKWNRRTLQLLKPQLSFGQSQVAYNVGDRLLYRNCV